MGIALGYLYVRERASRHQRQKLDDEARKAGYEDHRAKIRAYETNTRVKSASRSKKRGRKKSAPPPDHTNMTPVTELPNSGRKGGNKGKNRSGRKKQGKNVRPVIVIQGSQPQGTQQQQQQQQQQQRQHQSHQPSAPTPAHTPTLAPTRQS